MIDISYLVAPGINIALIGIIGYFIRMELHDIKQRLGRIEDTFFSRGES